MKTTVLFFSLLLAVIHSDAQNLVSNPDFEIYSSCPTMLDQVPRATGWLNVVASPDYYNCSFLSDPSFFPTTPGAFSGTGCTGFASYGNSVGASEAIGQYLTQPLLPNTDYTISFASKKTTGGSYASNCGGLALYGYENTVLPNAIISSHPSLIANAVFLGKTALIQNTTWQSYSFNFTPADTIDALVFTVEYVVNCGQYLFLDSINLREAGGPCPDITLDYTISVVGPTLQNGAVKITPTGGEAPYLYSLDNITFQSDNIFTSLGLGTYQVYVTDNNGCTTQGTFSNESNCNCGN